MTGPQDQAVAPRGLLVLAAVAGLVALAALRLWHGIDYWNYSEGVYALTSRLWIHGADLYGQMVGAQPPGMFIAGAGILSVHDSIGFLRTCVGLVQLGGGLVGALAVWRLSGSRIATAVTPALTLLTPWAVHEAGGLTPETLVGPLLFGGALLASRPRTAAAGGAIATLAVGVKLPFLLPVLGILATASDRRSAARAAAGTFVAMVVIGLLAFGSGLVRDVITAQLHSGRRGLGVLEGVWGQAGWSLVGLVAGAALLLVSARHRVRDPALLRVWVGLSAGLLVTVVSTYKEGTGLNVLVPVEGALLPLALCAVALVETVRWERLAIGAIAFTFVQTVALGIWPHRTAPPFIYPTSERGAWGRTLTGDEVRAQIAAARGCPPGVAYSMAPYLAFVAHRPPPAGQPDGFLTSRSPTLAKEGAAVAAVTVRCP